MNIKNTLAAAATVSLVSVGSASAAFLDFTVDPSGAGSAKNVFVADKITGNYTEVATFSGNTFNIALQWSAGQFVSNDGNTPLNGGGPFGTGLGADYGLYALYNASGTFSSAGSVTTFTFLTGSMSMYLDTGLDSLFTAPATGLGVYGVSNTADDVLIGTGGSVFVDGTGTLDPGLSTCLGGGINCGSFGVNNDFTLVNPAGGNFFVLPNPFYSAAFQSGQFNNFTPTGTQTINGSMDLVFQAVPEPASLALIGIGMLGMGMRSRKQRA